MADIGVSFTPGSSPTASEQYAYDGEGNRVWQQAQSVSGSTNTTTDTVYELGVDEFTTVSVTGQQATTTNIRSYPLPGGALAVRDGTGLYYLATDQLGTPIASLRLDDGTLVGTQLRTPYGQARYAATASTNGGMHTSFGFTGQREDTQAPGSSKRLLSLARQLSFRPKALKYFADLLLCQAGLGL